MSALLIICLFYYCAFGLTTAQVLYNSPCPTQFVASDFNITAYLGRWYQLQRYNGQATPKGDCSVVKYQSGGSNDTFQMTTEEVHLLPNRTEKKIVHGTMRLEKTMEFPPVGHLIANIGGNESDILVMNTDYSNYALVWSCETLDANKSAREYSLELLLIVWAN